MIKCTLGLTVKDYGPTMNQLKMIACCERPQERLENFGAAALSDTELLAILLRSGTHGYDVLTLASRLIAEAGSLAKLASWNEADFRRLKGIGRVKGGQLVAIMEIARRVIGKPSEEGPILSRADLVADYLRPHTVGLDVEKFWVLCLNRKNRLMKRVEVTSGTATATLAHPREVFRAAIRESASALVCAHSHPSGVILSGKRIRICRIRPQRGRFVEFICEWRRIWIGDRRIGEEMNEWVGCRGGAAGPAPLVNWGEGTWPTGDVSRLKFSCLIQWSPGNFHSNMNCRQRGRPAADTIIPSFCPARFPDFVTPAMVFSPWLRSTIPACGLPLRAEHEAPRSAALAVAGMPSRASARGAHPRTRH